MPRSIPCVSRTSIWRTWKAVRKELKHSSIRDLVDYLEYDVNPDVWITRLVQSIKLGTYEPASPRRFALGKSKGFSRTMTLPAIPDLVLYRTLVDYFYGKLRWQQHKHVYFLRGHLAEVRQQMARQPIRAEQLGLPHYRATSQRSFLNWLKYDQYRKHLVFEKVHPYFVITDVANFFDSVLHSHVAEALHGARLPSRTVGLLFFLLERLSIRQEYAGSHGISLPVDEFDCSRTLAHMVLFSHDDEMAQCVGENNYVRWMDDQNMGVESKARGLEVLGEVGRSLARLHLTPNAQKSKVLSLSEARRHFHLDLNKLLDTADDLAKQITSRKGGSRRELRSAVAMIWSRAKAFDGDGEFGKILKRLYRVAGLARGRLLRQRAVKDILIEPSLAERICDYMRCTGTIGEYLQFANAILSHPEQVYADVSVAIVESLLRIEAAGKDAVEIRRLASSLLKRERSMPGSEDCAAIAPLLILRFGDRRSLPLLKRTVEDTHRVQPAAVVRAAAITYASFGVGEFRTVRATAAKLLRNHLSETVRFLEEIQNYQEVPNRYKARLRLGWDAVAGLRFFDMRVLLMARLLMLNDRRAIRVWIRDLKDTALRDSLSSFDQRLILHWLT
jgi:hypothetical protein